MIASMTSPRKARDCEGSDEDQTIASSVQSGHVP